jgi:hypothetical protein
MENGRWFLFKLTPPFRIMLTPHYGAKWLFWSFRRFLDYSIKE